MKCFLSGMTHLVLAVFIGSSLVDGTVAAQETAPSKVGITALFSVEEQVAAYDADAKELRFLSLIGEQLKESHRFKVPGNVWALSRLPNGYAIATGLGRGDLDAPMRIQWFSKDGKASRSILERTGERTQVAYLNYRAGKLWITFFDSKYNTKTGYLTENPDASWAYKELVSTRLGDTVDVLGDSLVIGRPYGDVQGQDGDLSLYRGVERIELPSYRGVRAVRLFGDPLSPTIATGDGWHQNYGQFAQGRLNILKRDPASGRYALQLIDHDATQYGFSKIVDFTLNGKTYIAALGNKHLNVYGPAEEWKRHAMYSRSTEDTLFDLAFIRVQGGKAWFAVLDKEVKIVSFPAS